VAKDIYDVDPFVSLDRDGVGQLMRLAVASGRKTRPNIKIAFAANMAVIQAR